MDDPFDPKRELEPISPLVEYYVREMGQLAGRLMATLSMLVDLEDSHGWEDQTPQARETVRYSRALVASVLRVVSTAQAERGDDTGMGEAIDDALRGMFGDRNGHQADGTRWSPLWTLGRDVDETLGHRAGECVDMRPRGPSLDRWQQGGHDRDG